MKTIPDWFPTHGLVGGPTVQFSEGRWQDGVGAGIALNEDAFDLIEPVLAASCAEWTPMHRYGVMELSSSCRKFMVDLLRQQESESRAVPKQEMQLRSDLADWLADRLDARQIISVLGI